MSNIKIPYVVLDSLILFSTVIPSILRCDNILFGVIFGVLFLALNATTILSFGYIFRDLGKTKWKILLPFCVLSIFSNVFLDIRATFPFLAAALLTLFATKTTAERKSAIKNGKGTELRPKLTILICVFVVYAVLYTISGVMI